MGAAAAGVAGGTELLPLERRAGVCVVKATCELARELLVADRTAAPLGEGLKSSQVGDSVMVFDRAGRAPVLSHETIALLGKVGVYGGDGGSGVRLVRC